MYSNTNYKVSVTKVWCEVVRYLPLIYTPAFFYFHRLVTFHFILDVI